MATRATRRIRLIQPFMGPVLNLIFSWTTFLEHSYLFLLPTNETQTRRAPQISDEPQEMAPSIIAIIFDEQAADATRSAAMIPFTSSGQN